MARTYNSSRRAANAERTRQAIVEAAVRMHGQGITTLAAVAEEAGVALPTLTKHFPTREALFGACTHHVAERLEIPAPEEFLAVPDPAERVERLVRRLFELHEQMISFVWVGYRLEDESGALSAAVANYEAAGNTLADTVLRSLPSAPDKATIRFAQAVLNPLTYRALRLRVGLDFEQAVRSTTAGLAAMLGLMLPEDAPAGA